MAYIPHTDADRREMLQTIGVSSIEELFREIPDNLKIAPRSLNIPPAHDEAKLLARLRELAELNQDSSKLTCFLGAGIYDRFIPATVGAVISRGEFLTAYTPYQPELSQGYLQSIFEFQSMIAELYGMDVANASMYDASTSLAEAAIMAHSINGRSAIYISEAIHPNYRQVLETYCWSMSLTTRILPVVDGKTEFGGVGSDAAAVLVQYPNFYGVIEDLEAARKGARAVGATFIEGQPLGVAMGYGGPLVGLFACKQELVRRIPGRIVGRTTDHDGNEGYVMTLRTREQDIRREKATSNICTNEALMALAATVYMEAMGKNGMKQIAEGTVRNTQYALAELTKAGGKRAFGSKVFGEFVLELPKDAREVQKALIEKGILAGLPLGPFYPWMANCLLVAVTEIRTKEQIDFYAQSLKEVLA
jgi:glycine cleavage system P protein (glycine dehydrogenase) subunit 1